jgi:hypothetical protein
MRQLSAAGLLALALFVLSIENAQAGSVTGVPTKAEVRAARILLYEHEMSVFDKDPTRFDEHDPVLGRILASEEGFDAFLARHTFPRLLCKHTPFLWRVIDGDILYHRLHPFAIPATSPDSGPTPLGGNTSDGIPPGGTGITPDGGGPGGHDPGGGSGSGGGSGPTIHPASVPEPSSWVILASGVTFALIAALRRQIYRRLTGARGC